MAAEQQPHFLLIPYSEQGHLNPMLGLASHLLRLRCRVTLVKADRHLRPPSISDEAGAAVGAEPESGPPNAAPSAGDRTSSTAAAHEEGQQLIRVVKLPVRNKALCVDVKTMTRFQIFKNTMAGLEERQDLIAAIIEESKASAHPVTGIICDHLLWKWVRHLARAYPHLRSAVLCIFSALTFYTHYLNTQDKDVFIASYRANIIWMEQCSRHNPFKSKQKWRGKNKVDGMLQTLDLQNTHISVCVCMCVRTHKEGGGDKTYLEGGGAL